MKFDVISSGSKGNSTLIISNDDVILIDFGISLKRVNSALSSYGLGFQDVKAFLFTHDHIDHMKYIERAPEKLRYAANINYPKYGANIPQNHVLVPFKDIYVGNLKITTLPLSHDAENTIGFLISDGNESLVYITDTGYVPEKDLELIKNKNYYIFESNHDVQMLLNSKRPAQLIQRIMSDFGHLSNADSAYFLSLIISNNTKEIVLAHLSDECNRPDLAKKTFEEVMMKQLGYLPDVLLKTASAKNETKGGK